LFFCLFFFVRSAPFLVTKANQIHAACNADPCEGKRKRKEERALRSSQGGGEDAVAASSSSSATGITRQFASEVSKEREEEISQLLGRLVINDQTAEPQGQLIYQLENYVGLRGNAHWCIVKGVNPNGLDIEIVVEAGYQRWILNDITFLWEDMPEEIFKLPLEERMRLSSERLLVGTEFRGSCYVLPPELCA
jgi:hypothetical protein